MTDPQTAATGGLGGPSGLAGHVPARTDDALGASAQIRGNARAASPIGDRTRLLAREIIARYPRPRSALLPMLHLVQSEHGYVTPEGVAMCAEELGLSKAEVGAVSTFYTMFKRRPTGEYLVSVCTNTLCGFLGGEEIYTALSEHLGVGHDQTTDDGLITLEHAECLAACDYAPVVTVNYEFYDQQDPESAMSLVHQLQEGARPHPTRGAPLCSFKEMSRQLAGFYDPVADAAAVAGFSAGEPTLAGARIAVDQGHESPPYDAASVIPPVPPKAPPAPKAEPTKPVAPADPEPAAGKSSGKVAGEAAVGHADNPAEHAGAASADPDQQETKSPGPATGQPAARRSRTRRGRTASTTESGTRTDPAPEAS